MGFLGGQRRFEGSGEGALPHGDVGTRVAATEVTPRAEQSVLTSRRWVTTMLPLAAASRLLLCSWGSGRPFWLSPQFRSVHSWEVCPHSSSCTASPCPMVIFPSTHFCWRG